MCHWESSLGSQDCLGKGFVCPWFVIGFQFVYFGWIFGCLLQCWQSEMLLSSVFGGGWWLVRHLGVIDRVVVLPICW